MKEVQKFQLGDTAYMFTEEEGGILYEETVDTIYLRDELYSYSTDLYSEFKNKDIGKWVFNSKDERRQYCEENDLDWITVKYD